MKKILVAIIALLSFLMLSSCKDDGPRLYVENNSGYPDLIIDEVWIATPSTDFWCVYSRGDGGLYDGESAVIHLAPGIYTVCIRVWDDLNGTYYDYYIKNSRGEYVYEEFSDDFWDGNHKVVYDVGGRGIFWDY